MMCRALCQELIEDLVLVLPHPAKVVHVILVFALLPFELHDHSASQGGDCQHERPDDSPVVRDQFQAFHAAQDVTIQT